MTVRPVVLPDGPRGTMARLRGKGRFALRESALPMPRQAQWSYIAGPSLATLYTDETTTVMRPHVPFSAARAAATEASTSARPASCTCAITSPVAGERLLKFRTPLANSPLIKLRICLMSFKGSVEIQCRVSGSRNGVVLLFAAAGDADATDQRAALDNRPAPPKASNYGRRTMPSRTAAEWDCKASCQRAVDRPQLESNSATFTRAPMAAAARTAAAAAACAAGQSLVR